MRTLLYLVTALVVMVLAFWAYRENYSTQSQIDRMQSVQSQIATLRERLGVLRAEWAYLNRPERLTQLVNLNFDKLRLAPLTPGQFVTPKQVTFPTARAPSLDPVAPGDAWQGPSQNPGAPPRRPSVSAQPSPDLPPADPDKTHTTTATSSEDAQESQP